LEVHYNFYIAFILKTENITLIFIGCLDFVQNIFNMTPTNFEDFIINIQAICDLNIFTIFSVSISSLYILLFHGNNYVPGISFAFICIKIYKSAREHYCQLICIFCMKLLQPKHFFFLNQYINVNKDSIRQHEIDIDNPNQNIISSDDDKI